MFLLYRLNIAILQKADDFISGDRGGCFYSHVLLVTSHFLYVCVHKHKQESNYLFQP